MNNQAIKEVIIGDIYLSAENPMHTVRARVWWNAQTPWIFWGRQQVTHPTLVGAESIVRQSVKRWLALIDSEFSSAECWVKIITVNSAEAYKICDAASEVQGMFCIAEVSRNRKASKDGRRKEAATD